MGGGPVTDMPLEAIARPASGQAPQQCIAGLLGKHTGSGDRRTTQVTAHQGALLAAPTTQGQHPIHQQQRWGSRQPGQSTLHRPLRGSTDAMAINLAGAGLAKPPGSGMGVDQGHQPRAPPWRELLAVGETSHLQQGDGLAIQHHSRREHGTEQAAATHLIHTGAAGGILAMPGITAAVIGTGGHGALSRWRMSGGGGGVAQRSRPSG